MTDKVTIDQLLTAYQGQSQGPVRFRPATWARALASTARPDDLALLLDPAIGAASTTHPGDRLLARADVQAEVDEAVHHGDERSLVRAFLLVQAWGTGTSGNRTLRHTATALADRPALVKALTLAATMLREASSPDALADAYEAWSTPGVGRSFFTKWFAYAGRTSTRAWQPLVLDDRVLATLNDTLKVTTCDLAGSRRWPQRYQAYVMAAHRWGREFPGGPLPAEWVEWVLFKHAGAEARGPRPRLGGAPAEDDEAT